VGSIDYDGKTTSISTCERLTGTPPWAFFPAAPRFLVLEPETLRRMEAFPTHGGKLSTTD
jgi:hypothetical protein